MSGNQSTPFLKSDEEQNPPPTLSDIIEAERTRLLTAGTLLGCTAVAINNDQSVDGHQFDYGDMIELAREMIDETANRLDSTYMREFYDQLGRARSEFVIKGDRYHGMTIRVHGHTYPLLTINTSVCECGDIKDGISLVHHTESSPEDWMKNSEGWWVMALADLEAIYHSALAKRVRETMQGMPGEGDSAGRAPADAHAMEVGGGL